MLMLLAAVGLELNAQQFTYNTINHPTGDSTFVTGVSGTKVVGYYQYNGSQTSYGFIETAGNFTAIGGSIGPGINNTVVSIQPTGISGNTVVGGGLYTMGGSPELGFSYDITSGSYTIMPQGFGGASMIATGISNGLIVGYAGQISPPGNYWRKHSFTYDTNGYSAQLDYPDPLSLYEGIALSTQAQGTDGTTVVGYHLISDYNPLGVNYNYRGFTLNNGTWATLNAPNAFNTYAMGINGGNIVGYFNDFVGVHGFLYDGNSYLILDFPGAIETRAFGISGDVIVGSYVDSLGISRGFSTTIPETPITNTINELDSRIVRGRNLLFQGGTLAPTSSISLNTSVIVSSNSTGVLDSSAGSIQLLGTTVINGGAQLIIQGNDISSTQVTGQLSGQGILVVMGGINTISGLNTSGGTLITGGTLQVSTSDALPSVGNVINAGKLVLVNSTSNTLSYNQAFSFEGQGAPTTRTLILGTGNQTGAVHLTGQVNISADSTIATQGQTSSGHTIVGAITTTQPSTNLRLNTSALANLTVLGSIDDNISLVKEGAGILYFGSARAYSGAMNVSAGVAVISSPSSLGSATLRADGGSFELRGGLPSSSISYSAVLELGAPNSGGYAMTLGTADSQSSAVYNGAVRLLTSSTRITTAAYSGSHSLQGTITASSSNSTLTALVAAGSSLEVASSQIGFNGNFTKEGAGELRLNRAISGVLTVSSGAVTLGATGSSGGVIISNGAELIIESTSAALRQINQTINTSGFGSTGSSIIFRPYAQGGSIELTAPITLAGDTSIKAQGNTVQLNGLSGTGRTLTSDIAAGAYLKISGVSRVSRLVKNSPGSLEILNNFDGDIELRNGTAIVNAALTGSIISQNGTILKGSGFITGQVINSGTIAPGNSPGVLTINGSYTSTPGSFYDAEIAGIGGPGATNGHDMIAVTGVPGTFTIQANSGLRILMG
jgi:autotransporter-associated beta strand protein